MMNDDRSRLPPTRPTLEVPKGDSKLTRELRERDFASGTELLKPKENRNPESSDDSSAEREKRRSESDQKYADHRLIENSDDSGDDGGGSGLCLMDGGEPAIQTIALSKPIPFDEDELAKWALSQGYSYDCVSRRVFDPTRVRDEFREVAKRDPGNPRLMHTIIKLDAVGSCGASVVSTSLSSSGFASIAASIDRGFEATSALFCEFAKIAPPIVERRMQDHDAGTRRSQELAPQARKGAVAGIANPLALHAASDEQLEGALPVPEGTHGVFHLGPGDKVDISSAGFATCIGVVVVSRHDNGTRSVGMIHLNSSTVERYRSSFQSFIGNLQPGGSKLEYYLVGGAQTALESHTLALSLFDFMFALGAELKGTALFTEHTAFVAHSDDEGTSLHVPTSKAGKRTLKQKEEALANQLPSLALAAKLAQSLCMSPSELIDVCSGGKHPLAAD